MRRRGTILAAACLGIRLGLCLLASGSGVRAQAPASLFDTSSGYRIARYRAPVDVAPPAGVKQVTAEDVESLIAGGEAVLVDVLPSDGAGWDPASRSWRLAHPHTDIAGSTWLPDVGFGAPEPWQEAYFRANLERLTLGDKSRILVIYCQADCWMSWNASRRAAAYGYTGIRWFAEGVDGWRDFDRPFAPVEPVPVSPP